MVLGAYNPVLISWGKQILTPMPCYIAKACLKFTVTFTTYQFNLLISEGSTEHRERKCSEDHRFSFWKNNWKTIAFYGINKDSLKGTGSAVAGTGMLKSGYSYKTVLFHTGNLQHKLVHSDLLPSGTPLRFVFLNFSVHICYLPLTTVSSKLSVKTACPSNR